MARKPVSDIRISWLSDGRPSVRDFSTYDCEIQIHCPVKNPGAVAEALNFHMKWEPLKDVREAYVKGFHDATKFPAHIDVYPKTEDPGTVGLAVYESLKKAYRECPRLPETAMHNVVAEKKRQVQQIMLDSINSTLPGPLPETLPEKTREFIESLYDRHPAIYGMIAAALTRYPPGQERGEQKNKDVTLLERFPYTRLTKDDLVLLRTEAKRIEREVQERRQAEEAVRAGREAVREAMESGSWGSVHGLGGLFSEKDAEMLKALFATDNPLGDGTGSWAAREDLEALRNVKAFDLGADFLLGTKDGLLEVAAGTLKAVCELVITAIKIVGYLIPGSAHVLAAPFTDILKPYNDYYSGLLLAAVNMPDAFRQALDMAVQELNRAKTPRELGYRLVKFLELAAVLAAPEAAMRGALPRVKLPGAGRAKAAEGRLPEWVKKPTYMRPVVVQKSTPRIIKNITLYDRFSKTSHTLDIDLRPTFDRLRNGIRYPHRNDGATFNNSPVILPYAPPGYYTEYVIPTHSMRGAGVQRLVIGKGSEIYYTPNHYTTFIQIQ